MPTTETTFKYLTANEMERLLRAVADARDKAIIRLTLDHGLRASEVGLLDFGDYSPGKSHQPDRIMLKRVKGSFGGDTVLGLESAAALRKWVRLRGQVAGPLFVTRNRTGICRTSLDGLMKKYCGLAEIPAEKAHFHTLKHTCALQTLRETGSIVSVQAKLGYADIRSAVPYAEILHQEQNGAAVRATPTSVLPSPIESGNVYFVETEDGQHVKIGFSSRQPSARFSEFGTLRPSTFAIRLIGSFPASRQTETWLHEKFASDRDNGEWFRKTPKIAALIQALLV